MVSLCSKPQTLRERPVAYQEIGNPLTSHWRWLIRLLESVLSIDSAEVTHTHTYTHTCTQSLCPINHLFLTVFYLMISFTLFLSKYYLHWDLIRTPQNSKHSEYIWAPNVIFRHNGMLDTNYGYPLCVWESEHLFC